MKIRAIEVYGFGIFSGRFFSVDAPVTLFYGKNEAGKSTLMQLIRFLFFGFPERTRPEQRYAPLYGGRHGGAVQFALPDGKVYRLERLGERGSRPLLYDEAGSVLDEAEWSRIFGGMTGETYRQLFAFGLDELQEIGALQREEVSRYLFDAGFGAGAGQLLKAEKRLRTEMERLYRPKGTTQPIYHLVKAIEHTRKEMAESAERQEQYETLGQKISACEQEIARWEEERDRAVREMVRLETALNMRERWLRNKEIAAELATLALDRTLPPDATERFDALVRDADKLNARIAAMEQEWIATKERMDGLEPDRELLALKDRLELLWQRSGTYTQQREHADKLDTEIEARSEAMHALIRRIHPNWTEAELLHFAADPSRRLQVTDFRDRMTQMKAQLEQAEVEMCRLKQQAEQEKREHDACEQSLFSLEQNIQEQIGPYREMEPFLKDVNTLLETWDAFRFRFAEYQQLGDRLDDLALYRPATDEPRAAIHPDTPFSRKRRFGRKWRGLPYRKIAAFALTIILPAALWIGDLHEAALVSLFFLLAWDVSLLVGGASARKQSELRTASDAEIDAYTKVNAYTRKRAEELLERREQLERELRHRWHTIERLIGSLSGDGTKAGWSEAAATVFSTPVQSAFSEWPGTEEMEALEKEVRQWAAKREKVLELKRQKQALIDREAIQHRRVESLQADLLAAEERYRKWRGDLEQIHRVWEGWLREHDLPATLTPHDALELLQESREVLQLRDEKEHRVREQEALKKELAAFEQEAASVIDFSDAAAIPALLKQRMDEVMQEVERERERQELARRLAERKAEINALRAERQQLEQRMHELLVQCGAADENELRQRAQEQKRRRELEAEARQNEVFFMSWLGEKRFEEACELLERYGGEELAHQLEHWRAKRSEAETRLDALRREWGALTLRRQQLQTEADLVAKRLQYEANVTELAEMAERWAVRAFALELFRMAKERHERSRQPQVLQDASRYFAEMTGGRYRRVLAPVGEKRLLAEKENGEQIDPGTLSRGTAEQMYLAMRLALAGEYAAQGTAMPLVMDDVFVNFDAERLEASLRVLNEVSSRHQILLFTCHQHVAEMAAKAIGGLKTVWIDRQPNDYS